MNPGLIANLIDACFLILGKGGKVLPSSSEPLKAGCAANSKWTVECKCGPAHPNCFYLDCRAVYPHSAHKILEIFNEYQERVHGK